MCLQFLKLLQYCRKPQRQHPRKLWKNYFITNLRIYICFFYRGATVQIGPRAPLLKFCRPHTNIQKTEIGIFRTSDQLVAEATTHTTEMNTRDESPSRQWDLKPRFQQLSSCRLHCHWDHCLLLPSALKQFKKKMGPIVCPETSVTNYQPMVCNISEERKSQQRLWLCLYIVQ